METKEAIRSRRSIRRFEEREVPEEFLREILQAGIWAPSGMNNQPWRFVIIRDKETKEKLSRLTHYGDILRGAPLLIGVFLDHKSSYDYVKDVQACGACLQNMLLSAHDLGLGAVWIGEILKSKEKVREVLGLSEEYELMAIVCVGFPKEKPEEGKRRPLDHFILKVIE